MKRILIITIAMLAICQSSFAWGRLGHATIAKIAEDHLTPKAKKFITEYLNGESIVAYSVYADEFKNDLLVDVGFEPNNGKRVTTYPHTFEVNSECKPFRGINDNGRYVKNCIHFIDKLAAELKDHKDMSDSLRFHHIMMITHFVADMHCPQHIRYNPEDMTIGSYQVSYNGKPVKYHKLWDTDIITTLHPWGFSDLAYLLDTYTTAQIKAVTAGDTYDWAEESAICSKPAHQVKAGAKLTNRFAIDNRNLVESQIRKAGYRLAKVLNECFR